MKFYLYAMKGTKTKWMYCSDFKQDNLAHKALDESEHWRIFHRKVARKAPEAGELSINPKIQENVRITVNNLTAMNTSLVPWWRQNWCQQSYLSLKLRDTKFRSTPFKKKSGLLLPSLPLQLLAGLLTHMDFLVEPNICHSGQSVIHWTLTSKPKTVPCQVMRCQFTYWTVSFTSTTTFQPWIREVLDCHLVALVTYIFFFSSHGSLLTYSTSHHKLCIS